MLETLAPMEFLHHRPLSQTYANINTSIDNLITSTDK